MASREEERDTILQLSCESSDFDSDLEASEFDSHPIQSCGNIQPYQFEPQISSSDNDSGEGESQTHDNQTDPSRLTSMHWCHCDNCLPMDTIKECCCCTEMDEMQALIREEGVHCITEHPGFHSVCLDIYVLRTCYRWYQQQYGREIADENNRYRYTAYRMLARFAWGWLGKDVRVTLPACAVRKIRETFPSATGNYTGYLEPEN